MDYVNQVLLSSVTSKAEVVSTSERGKTLIVLYFFLFTSFILNDFLRSNGEGVNDEAFSFRLSIIELLEVLCGALGDLPPLNVSSFSAKSIIGLKFLSVSFSEMVLSRSPFSVPMDRGHCWDTYCETPCRKAISYQSEELFLRCLYKNKRRNSLSDRPHEI